MAPTKGSAAITDKPKTKRAFIEIELPESVRVCARGRPQPQQLKPSEVLLIRRSPQ